MKEIYYARELESKVKFNAFMAVFFSILVVIRGILHILTPLSSHPLAYITYLSVCLFVFYMTYTIISARKRAPFPKIPTQKNLLKYQLDYADGTIFKSSSMFLLGFFPLFFILVSFLFMGGKISRILIEIFNYKIYLYNGIILVLSLLYIMIRINHMLNFHRKNYIRINESYFEKSLLDRIMSEKQSDQEIDLEFNIESDLKPDRKPSASNKK